MRVEFDPRAEAVYVRLREGAVHETRELMDCQVIVDLDDTGALLGVEVLGVPAQMDEFGYAHVDVAITTSEGRVVKVKPRALQAAKQPPTGR